MTIWANYLAGNTNDTVSFVQMVLGVRGLVVECWIPNREVFCSISRGGEYFVLLLLFFVFVVVVVFFLSHIILD